MAVHQLAAISWPAFRVLRSSRLVAVLPLGAIEAHGPHLPLGTDILIAEAMARAGAERLASRGLDVLLLPTLPVGPAPFAAAFEGTIDTAPAATAATIEGIARSLGTHGVALTVIANAHHDPANVRAIRDAVTQIEKEGSTRLLFPDLTRRRWASRLTDEFQSGACHAGRYETSVVMAVAAETVDAVVAASLAPNPQSLVAAIQRGDRTFADAGGPDAYFGAPGEATAEEGRDIIDRLAAIIEDAVVAALEDRADR
ncbi:MAG TPA: creatininase family protein [Vicinamibacterales bacterium]|nr:creatininase family protein [Vicinamibacterales bacterium]